MATQKLPKFFAFDARDEINEITNLIPPMDIKEFLTQIFETIMENNEGMFDLCRFRSTHYVNENGPTKDGLLVEELFVKILRAMHSKLIELKIQEALDQDGGFFNYGFYDLRGKAILLQYLSPTPN